MDNISTLAKQTEKYDTYYRVMAKLMLLQRIIMEKFALVKRGLLKIQ
jgi:hypothetical protein